MKHLITKFKKDQLAIIYTLEKANRTGVNTTGGKNLVKEARRKISNHIEFDVYQLKTKIAKDPQNFKSEKTKIIIKRLMIYQNELNRFSRKFSEFTGANLGASVQLRHLSYDFSNLVANLRQRFQKDENEIVSALNFLELRDDLDDDSKTY